MADSSIPLPELDKQASNSDDLNVKVVPKSESILTRLDKDENVSCFASMLHPHDQTWLYVVCETDNLSVTPGRPKFWACEEYQEDNQDLVSELLFPEDTDYESALGFLFNHIYRVVDEDEKKPI
jgi:hypothetical protein